MICRTLWSQAEDEIQRSVSDGSHTSASLLHNQRSQDEVLRLVADAVTSASLIRRPLWSHAAPNDEIQTFEVNGEQRSYLPYQFDTSKVNKPPSKFMQSLEGSKKTLKIYNFICYGAGWKNKRWVLSRCYLFNKKTGTHRYILMRVMTTTCESPNRVYYVYDSLTKQFSKEAGMTVSNFYFMAF